MQTDIKDLKERMNRFERKLNRISQQFDFRARLITKLYRSAFFFHQITAFKITDTKGQLIPFTYDNGQSLTEDGYITRYWGRKYPHVIAKVQKYHQDPNRLTLDLNVNPVLVKSFASRLYTITDVRNYEVNLDTEGDTNDQLASDMIMFSSLLSRVLTHNDGLSKRKLK